jgi:hypothetical protein
VEQKLKKERKKMTPKEIKTKLEQNIKGLMQYMVSDDYLNPNISIKCTNEGSLYYINVIISNLAWDKKYKTIRTDRQLKLRYDKNVNYVENGDDLSSYVNNIIILTNSEIFYFPTSITLFFANRYSQIRANFWSNDINTKYLLISDKERSPILYDLIKKMQQKR